MGYQNQYGELIDILRGGLAGMNSRLAGMSELPGIRITALEDSSIAAGTVVEAVGVPAYISAADLSGYSAYGLTEAGWYVFARITAKQGGAVVAQTTVTGADGYIATTGADHVDVAVKFGVTGQSKKVTVTWDAGGTDVDEFVFRAGDLAVRNLDYRTTFYIYDIADFVTWQFAENTDDTFQEGKNYYTESDGEYSKATVTAGDPARYFERSVSYSLTADETFQDGKTYYTESEGVYTEAEVTTGEAVTAETYYEQTVTYSVTEDTAFADGKTYYIHGESYTEATVTPTDPIVTYYKHSKAIFAGMARNITYKLDEIIDCPIEITLPEIDDDGYGAWFEIQLRYDGSYSATLTPAAQDVVIGTAQTQSQTAGINVIDLQYTEVAGLKMWTLLNTHSNLPSAEGGT